jgi:hypothetical protein
VGPSHNVPFVSDVVLFINGVTCLIISGTIKIFRLFLLVIFLAL